MIIIPIYNIACIDYIARTCTFLAVFEPRRLIIGLRTERIYYSTILLS